ncbi:MAG: L(+)-tartrate dehydratase subunit beta [Clostridia bacterium]|nr:L(+)-tartrate dehydratase subunit beta [Clostridia bacterium]
MIYEFKTPVSDEDIKKLRIGDVIYLTGDIVTGRDDVHHRAVLQNKDVPYDLKGKAIFHAGPIMRKNEDGSHKVVSVGPTTSMRMEACEAEFLEKTGVKIIIGKGGMGPKTTQGCKDNIAVHTIYPGGCAVVAAESVKEVIDVEWLDLGMPEALWHLDVDHFGPLIVSIDTEGGNLIDDNKKIFNERKESIVKEISAKLDFLE